MKWPYGPIIRQYFQLKNNDNCCRWVMTWLVFAYETSRFPWKSPEKINLWNGVNLQYKPLVYIVYMWVDNLRMIYIFHKGGHTALNFAAAAVNVCDALHSGGTCMNSILSPFGPLTKARHHPPNSPSGPRWNKSGLFSVTFGISLQIASSSAKNYLGSMSAARLKQVCIPATPCSVAPRCGALKVSPDSTL